MRDRLAAFLYWAAYWLEAAADRAYYGKGSANLVSVRRLVPQQRNLAVAEFEALTKEKP